jgi:hypothetical protein
VGSLGCSGYLCAGRLCVVHSHDGAEEEGSEGLEAEEGAVGSWIVGSVVGVLRTRLCAKKILLDSTTEWAVEAAWLHSAKTWPGSAKTWPGSAFDAQLSRYRFHQNRLAKVTAKSFPMRARSQSLWIRPKYPGSKTPIECTSASFSVDVCAGLDANSRRYQTDLELMAQRLVCDSLCIQT